MPTAVFLYSIIIFTLQGGSINYRRKVFLYVGQFTFCHLAVSFYIKQPRNLTKLIYRTALHILPKIYFHIKLRHT